MIKRIAAIIFIFLCTTVAWAILGATIFERTYSSDSSSQSLVASTWGAPQNQLPPAASYDEMVPKKEVSTENGKRKEIITQEIITNVLPLESSHLNVDLNLEHRQKGLLWYSTYKVGFDGSYSFRNPSDKDQTIAFTLNFPTAQAIYDDLVFTVDDVPITLKNERNSAGGTARVAAGKTATLKVGYKSQGLNDWHYSFGNTVVGTPPDEAQYRAGVANVLRAGWRRRKAADGGRSASHAAIVMVDREDCLCPSASISWTTARSTTITHSMMKRRPMHSFKHCVPRPRGARNAAASDHFRG